MTDTFNPYREWLHIEYAGVRPNNYELLGLSDLEGDPDQIRSAADAAMSRVRGFRPGEHAAEWAELLDELDLAKETLSEARQKQEYDARLQRERTGERPRPTNPAPLATPMAVPVAGAAPQALPLVRPQSVPIAAPAPAPFPAATQPPGAVDPMAPVAGIPFASPTTAAPLATSAQLDAPLQPLPVPSAQALRATAAAHPATPGPHFQGPLVSSNPSTFGQATARARNSSQFSTYVGAMVVAVLLAVGLLLFAFIPFRDRLLGDAQTAENPPSPPVHTRPIPPFRSPTHSIPTLEPVPRPLPEQAPVPMPVPDPTPEPVPDPLPTPAPVPEPTPAPVPEQVPEPTPAERAALGAAMRATRQALADRDLPLAKSKIAEAEQLAKSPEHVTMAARLRDLYECVFQFWKGVSAGMAQLNSTGELQINNTIVAVVESDSERIVIHVAGRNRRYVLKELPSGLAMAIARNWFDETEPDTIVYQGAFLAVDPNAEIENARAKWKEAAARGAKVDELMQVLDDDYDL